MRSRAPGLQPPYRGLVDPHPTRQHLVINALDMAGNQQPAPGRIVHADHGVQLTSWAFGNKIRSTG